MNRFRVLMEEMPLHGVIRPKALYSELLRRTSTNLASFPTGFPGIFRIVSEVAPTDLASCTASFTRSFWIVGKIAGTTSVLLLCHRKTSYQCSIR